MKFIIFIIIILILINLTTCLKPKFQATIRHKKSDQFLGILTLIRPFVYGLVPTGCLKKSLNPKDLYVILPNGEKRNVTEVNNNDCLGLTLLRLNPSLPQNNSLVKHIVTDTETIYEDGCKIYAYGHYCVTPKKGYVDLEECRVQKLNIRYCDKIEYECFKENCPPRPIICIHGIQADIPRGWHGSSGSNNHLIHRCGEAIIRKTHSGIPYLYAVAYPKRRPVCEPVIGSTWIYADLQSADTQKWIKSITKTENV